MFPSHDSQAEIKRMLMSGGQLNGPAPAPQQAGNISPTPSVNNPVIQGASGQ